MATLRCGLLLSRRTLREGLSLPLVFSYDPDRHLLITTASGVLSREDLDQIEMPDIAPGTLEIFDARGVTELEIGAADVREVSVVDLTSPTRVTKMALVLAADESSELARTYQAMTATSATRVAIFRDIREARRWLGLQDEDPSAADR